MTPGLRDLCLEMLVRSVEPYLGLQWSDGRFEVDAEGTSADLNKYHQQYLLAAALLYTLDHPANPWYRDARLREAIRRNGAFLVASTTPAGEMAGELNGWASRFPCERLTESWLKASQLLREHLADDEAAAWRDALQRRTQRILEHHVLPYREARRFRAHEVRTGTNHFCLYLTLLYDAGRTFGRPEWVEVATDLLRRLIADQHASGYWEEHHGPALGYDHLTYHGVAEYAAWSGDAAAVRALRRGLDFHKPWCYPDGVPIACLDGRMRHFHLAAPLRESRIAREYYHCALVSAWGLAGMTRWADGRGYVRMLLEQLAGGPGVYGGELYARLADAYLLLQEGDEEPAPQTQPRYRSVLEGVSVVRKEGPWVAALSGQCSPTWPENEFMLDRQALLSLWRAGSGLVLDGSNAKGQPEFSTFAREGDSLPRAAGSWPCGPTEEAVSYLYDSFHAELRVRLDDAGAVELRCSATPTGPGAPITAGVVPAVGLGETAVIDGVGEVTLGEQELQAQGARLLAFRGVKLTLPAGSEIRYPANPFNSYRPSGQHPPAGYRMVARFPVAERETVVRVEAGR